MQFGIDRHAIAVGIPEVVALGTVEVTEHCGAAMRDFVAKLDG